jgi:hypothetical protein
MRIVGNIGMSDSLCFLPFTQVKYTKRIKYFEVVWVQGAEETGEDCIMRSFITCTLHQILSG